MRAVVLALMFTATMGFAGLVDDLEFYDGRLGRRIDMGPIEPQSVSGFELLYATPGAGDVSEVAGHLLLRVRLRNGSPNAVSQIGNPNDLIISMLADTEAGRPPQKNVPIVVKEDCHRRNWLNLVESRQSGESPLASIWQSLLGLSGGFHISMDRQTLSQTLKSYTIEQDRDLLRYRLNLSETQKVDLLTHIAWAKENYQPNYFFFSQNCGSILIKVIGQGIGDEMLVNFDPKVSPPHALVGYMLRRGLITRETPSFYSYRKRGFIAQKVFCEMYTPLAQAFPEHCWPGVSELFHSDETVRARAIAQWSVITADAPELNVDIYRLASLAQETEMVHSHKDWVCEDYTSDATLQARSLQKQILAKHGQIDDLKMDPGKVIDEAYAPIELANAARGSGHTELYPVALGAGILSDKGKDDVGVTSLEAALLKQEMGSPSRVAMQRQSAVVFGRVELLLEGDQVQHASFTALDLAKFRDTLGGVPSVFTSTRGLGLGLTVLDLEHHRNPHQTGGTIAGIAMLGNLMSSSHYEDFLYVSLGADAVCWDIASRQILGLSLPIEAASLITLDAEMKVQWRNTATYLLPLYEADGILLLASRFSWRLGEFRGREFVLGLSAEYEKHDSARHQDRGTVVGKCQLQVNRW